MTTMYDGDRYVRRLAAFIRANEAKLAFPPFLRLKQTYTWFPFQSRPNPVVLSLDFLHLNYVLVRLEAVGLDVGPLDVRVDTPFHPTSYHGACDLSDSTSLASFKSSISTITSLSLPSYWWNGPNPDNIDRDLKYIYSCFTKLPAISIKAPCLNFITELAGDPDTNALPLHMFKNIQSLECTDIDPRTLIGWNRLAESLKSLKICRSGIDDFGDIFIRAVLDDQLYPDRQSGYEQTSHTSNFVSNDTPPDESSTTRRTSTDGHLKWAFLRYLSLKDNAITFFPVNVISCLTPLNHLDLSCNLLVSVPPGLNALYKLISLDLSDNMIDSIIGIYTQLGNVRTLNLSRNRLETICGLERLNALEHIDLRHNLIQETAEIGRLSALPSVSEVWIDGNPFVKQEKNYRMNCLEYFWREGKTIQLEGVLPNLYERKGLALRAPERTSVRRLSGSSQANVKQPNEASGNSTTPVLDVKTGLLTAIGEADSQIKRGKSRRVVQLNQQDEFQPTHHARDARKVLLLLDHFGLPAPTSNELSGSPRGDLRHSRFHTDTLLRCDSDSFLIESNDANYPGDGKEETLRARIETLRRDMGEGWLTVFGSQV
ncbi:hypothetical protein AX15_007069 [Amanita polypyramis BW_CC]|nr:hypothetical protein AX15_007069 [Amanita polypyramis BW_CC]